MNGRGLAEITHQDYPGERLIACRNPLLAAERARKRQELLAATENDLLRLGSPSRPSTQQTTLTFRYTQG